MMKTKIISITLSVFFLTSALPGIAIAQSASPFGAKSTIDVQELRQKAEDTRNTTKAQRNEKVRTSIISIYESYAKLTTRAGQLLDKLQIRIDRAKLAGENTSTAEAAMKDARAKLADATKILENIKGKKDTAVDKMTFQALRRQLQSAHKDINAVRLDAAKIISTLKSFSSANESTKSPILNKTGR